MKRELVFTKKRSDEIIRLPDDKLSDMNELVDMIKTNYDFIIGYIPEGYNSAFLLEIDDKEDSRNDKWKVVFFNKGISYGTENKTITLDNMDDIDESKGEEHYEVIKVIEGNYEDIINSSVDLIKKYRDSNEEDEE
jgi:hypothetical protein